jgi:ATP-dependent DNA helicase RecG
MPTTTIEELERLIQAPTENENLEFKAAERNFDSGRLLKYCVALSNEGGGKLILGVTNNHPRRVVGTQSASSPAGKQKKIFDTLGFLVRVEAVKHPNGRVVIFHIPARPIAHPQQYDGAYWMRSGEDLVPMTPERLRDIFAEGDPDWLMRSARDSCSAADVIALLDTHLYYQRLKQPYPTTQGRVLEKLENEKLIFEDNQGYSITNLGAVLFGRKLDQFEGLLRKAPRVIVYEGSDKLDASGADWPGTKGYVVGFEGLIDFINAYLPTSEVIKAFRDEVKMFPEVAIRELVANALIHQDFSETGTSVTIEIYKDRLEISNPGKPIIPPDRFADEYQSRNEALAGLLRRIGICEEQGLGIDRVIASCEAYGLPAPDFRLGERHTVAVLFGPKNFRDMDRQERIRACFWHCVLCYVSGRKMTNSSLRERFALSEKRAETVSRVISDTMHDHRIKPDDPSRKSRKLASYVPYWA